MHQSLHGMTNVTRLSKS
ncbi:hypothetical protein LINPERPRIM_LOCUS21051 [Linum perenne]